MCLRNVYHLCSWCAFIVPVLYKSIFISTFSVYFPWSVQWSAALVYPIYYISILFILSDFSLFKFPSPSRKIATKYGHWRCQLGSKCGQSCQQIMFPGHASSPPVPVPDFMSASWVDQRKVPLSPALASLPRPQSRPFHPANVLPVQGIQTQPKQTDFQPESRPFQGPIVTPQGTWRMVPVYGLPTAQSVVPQVPVPSQPSPLPQAPDTRAPQSMVPVSLPSHMQLQNSLHAPTQMLGRETSMIQSPCPGPQQWVQIPGMPPFLAPIAPIQQQPAGPFGPNFFPLRVIHGPPGFQGHQAMRTVIPPHPPVSWLIQSWCWLCFSRA